jgi:transcription elongation factor GreA
VIVEGGDPEVVSVGSRVVIEDGDRGRLEIEISGLGGQGTSSPSSPLGAALLGRRVGETVEVAAPKGSWQAKIVEIRAS